MSNRNTLPLYYNQSSGREYIDLADLTKIRYIVSDVDSPVTDLDIVHDKNTKNLIVKFYDHNNVEVIPDYLKLNDNDVEMNFNQPVYGSVKIIFLEKV